MSVIGKSQSDIHSTEATDGQQGWLKSARNLLQNPWLHIALLVGLVCLCFGRTTGSYFLADDFGEIRYVSRIFNGEPKLLLDNFTGNYMQIQSMNVYRPVLLLTLASDYMFWHATAFGYYLTNILYYLGDVCALYLVARQLTAAWSPVRRGLVSFFAAALFAANPLHCESVSWVVGRVDAACCFFYLCSLLMFLKRNDSHSKVLTAGGIACYLAALLVKEMAIGLPVLLTCYFFLWPIRTSSGSEFTLRSRITQSISSTIGLWIATVLYFVVRYLALGTLLGGYTGSIGAGQSSAALQRWLDLDSLHRFFFPLAASIFNSANPYERMIGALYLILATTLAVRLLSGNFSWRWIAFSCVWIVTAAAPIYRLWGIGFDLEGARFAFFLTVPLSLSLPLLLFFPVRNPGTTSLERKLLPISAVALLVFTITMAKVAYATDVSWVHAGKEVRKLSKEAEKLLAENPGQKIIVLGIPKKHAGAHMILNGDTFRIMLSPPFVTNEESNRFLTFDPILFGPSEFINASRFKLALQKSNTSGPYVWSSKYNRFQPIHLLPPFSNSAPEIKLTPRPFSNQLAMPSVNPLQYDLLQCQVRAPVSAGALTASATWTTTTEINGTASAVVPASTESTSSAFRTVTIPLSHYFTWYLNPQVTELTLDLPEIKNLQIGNIRLVPSTAVMPYLEASGLKQAPTGVSLYSSKNDKLLLRFDASKISGASKVSIQISKTNFFFDNFDQAAQSEAVGQSFTLPSITGQFTLAASKLPQSGFYEIRIVALNADQQPLGAASDSVAVMK